MQGAYSTVFYPLWLKFLTIGLLLPIDGYGYRRVGHLASGMEASAWCGAGRNGFGLGYTPSQYFGKPRLLKQATTRCGRPSVDAQEPTAEDLSMSVTVMIECTA